MPMAAETSATDNARSNPGGATKRHTRWLESDAQPRHGRKDLHHPIFPSKNVWEWEGGKAVQPTVLWQSPKE